jgi:hypothetical protein
MLNTIVTCSDKNQVCLSKKQGSNQKSTMKNDDFTFLLEDISSSMKIPKV